MVATKTSQSSFSASAAAAVERPIEALPSVAFDWYKVSPADHSTSSALLQIIVLLFSVENAAKGLFALD